MLFSFALLCGLIFTPAHARLADSRETPVQEVAAGSDVDGNEFLAVDPELPEPESAPMSTQREGAGVSRGGNRVGSLGTGTGFRPQCQTSVMSPPCRMSDLRSPNVVRVACQIFGQCNVVGSSAERPSRRCAVHG